MGALAHKRGLCFGSGLGFYLAVAQLSIAVVQLSIGSFGFLVFWLGSGLGFGSGLGRKAVGLAWLGLAWLWLGLALA